MSNTYSVKYLGISNGQVGILSKRLPIPRLRAMDTCKNKPLSVVYAAAYRPPKSPRMSSLKPRIDALEESFKDSTVSEVRPLEHLPENLSKSDSEPSGPLADPQKYDVYLVNKYSRPRGLRSVRRPRNSHSSIHGAWLEDRFDLYNRRAIVTPLPRTGMAGWKISRPRTPISRASPQLGMRRSTPVDWRASAY
jgi:hypothetical protein